MTTQEPTDPRREAINRASREYRRRKYADPIGREIILAANRAANMSTERLERRRLYDRERQKVANLTPEQLEKKRSNGRKRARKWYLKSASRPVIRASEQKRYNTDIQFKLRKVLRARLSRELRLGLARGSAVRDLGCSIAEFKTYIETHFEPGMSWDNWSQYGWHLDHIRPLSHFDLNDPSQFLTAIHFTNLQPMWATKNHSKGYDTISLNDESNHSLRNLTGQALPPKQETSA